MNLSLNSGFGLFDLFDIFEMSFRRQCEKHMAEKGYTTIGHKLGFGPMRKLPRLNDRKSGNIRNMDRLAIVQPRGFGTVQIPSLCPIVVYFESAQKSLKIPKTLIKG